MQLKKFSISVVFEEKKISCFDSNSFFFYLSGHLESRFKRLLMGSVQIQFFRLGLSSVGLKKIDFNHSFSRTVEND